MVPVPGHPIPNSRLFPATVFCVPLALGTKFGAETRTYPPSMKKYIPCDERNNGVGHNVYGSLYFVINFESFVALIGTA